MGNALDYIDFTITSAEFRLIMEGNEQNLYCVQTKIGKFSVSQKVFATVLSSKESNQLALITQPNHTDSQQVPFPSALHLL